MLSKLHAIFFLCFVAYAASQTYTKLDFKDCGSRNVKIDRLSFLPMPILQPGSGKLSCKISSSEPIKGIVKADIKIVRKVSGINLPVNCYIVEGEQVGSCSYPDLCGLMKRLVQQDECPPHLAIHGIDCECPVDITTTTLDIDMDATLPKAPEYASWLSVGDFDVNLKATVGANLYAFEDDGNLPWHKTKYLTQSNWTTLLKANDHSSKIHHPVWFIFNYLTYCGFCKQAEPGWEAAAAYAAGWSRYIRIGAYDCASDTPASSDICQDEGYPQWRIYCPLTNSTQLAFDSERRNNKTTPEDILMWSIKKINKISHHCYGKSWPIRHVIEPQTQDDLNNIIPKNIKTFQLFVSDDVLLYSLYVLNNSKTVSKEPIYRLHTQNPVTHGSGLWKGMKNDDGRISLEKIDSTKAMQPFALDKNIATPTDKHKHKTHGSLKPTSTDIDSAVVWMLNKDVRRKVATLYDDIKSWLKVLHTYYAGSDTMKNFLHDLINFMNDRTTLSPKEFQTYINSTSVIKLPVVQFDHCNSSDPSKRGYPCSLWVLFHSMTVKQSILAEQNQLPSPDIKSSDMMVSIREYVRKFFLCEECAKHFANMTSNVENEIHSYKDSVLYLWRSHNQVNKRLRDDELTNDPAWPKVPFPTKSECDSCVRQVDENDDASEYDENATYDYLKDYYSLQTATGKKNNSGTEHRSNLFISFFSLMVFFICERLVILH